MDKFSNIRVYYAHGFTEHYEYVLRPAFCHLSVLLQFCQNGHLQKCSTRYNSDLCSFRPSKDNALWICLFYDRCYLPSGKTMWLCSEHQKLPRVTVLQSADLVYCSEAHRENAESVLLEELQQLQREEKQTLETEDQSNVRGNIIPRDTRKAIIPRDTRNDIIPRDTRNGIHSNGNTFKLPLAELCASSVADEVARGILRVYVLFYL